MIERAHKGERTVFQSEHCIFNSIFGYASWVIWLFLLQWLYAQ